MFEDDYNDCLWGPFDWLKSFMADCLTCSGVPVDDANIIADVLMMLSRDLENAVKQDGLLILSGILDKYIEKVERKFSSMKCVEKYQKDEWFTLVLQRN